MEMPVRRIIIPEDQQRLLDQDVWRDDFIHAHWLDGRNAVPINLRYRGGHTRTYPKKSYEIRYPNWTYHFNAEYDDPSMIRNALSFEFFQQIGVESPNTMHCRLEINGENCGIYLQIEAVDEDFFRKRNIDCDALFYAGNDDANFSLLCPDTGKLKRSLFDGYELVLGSTEEKKRLESFIFHLNTREGKSLLNLFRKRLDVPNYLRWLAGAVCTGNYDGFSQNYAIYEENHSKLYRMIPWDYEGSWGRNCFGEPCTADSVRLVGYNILTKQLLKEPVTRLQYRDILSEILTKHFTVEQLYPLIKERLSQIRQDIIEDTGRRWTIEDFDGEVTLMRKFIRQRRRYLLRELKSL